MDHWILKRVHWKKKFALLPKMCCYSKKHIWLSFGYRGTRMITGPGTPVVETYWLSLYHYYFLKIKGLI